MSERARRLERKSRAAFDASVESMDGATRSKLARARASAIEGLKHRRFAVPVGWVQAGAAAAAIVAAFLWLREEAAPTASPATTAVAPEDLDIVAGGEDFNLLAEDADFLAWAATETDGSG